MFFNNRTLLTVFFICSIFCFFADYSTANNPCRDIAIQDSNSLKKIDSLIVEIKSESSRFDSLKREFSDLKIELANKYLDWVSYVFVAGTFIAALLSVYSAHLSSLKYKEVREESKEYFKRSSKLTQDIESISKQIQDSKQRFNEGVNKTKEETGKLRNDFLVQIRRSQDTVNSWLRVFEENIETNTEILTELMQEFGEMTGIKITKEKLLEIRDRIYQKQLYLYDLSSYIADLNSENKEERIRAIWGIEGMGEKENIKDLQKIADNKDEDPDIRVIAQQAVENMKRRLGIQ